MTHDKIVAFFVAMTAKSLVIYKQHVWPKVKAALRQRVRRHFDRYFRVGRHRPSVVGYQNVRWASHLVAEMREERQIQSYQLEYYPSRQTQAALELVR